MISNKLPGSTLRHAHSYKNKPHWLFCLTNHNWANVDSNVFLQKVYLVTFNYYDINFMLKEFELS